MPTGGPHMCWLPFLGSPRHVGVPASAPEPPRCGTLHPEHPPLAGHPPAPGHMGRSRCPLQLTDPSPIQETPAGGTVISGFMTGLGIGLAVADFSQWARHAKHGNSADTAFTEYLPRTLSRWPFWRPESPKLVRTPLMGSKGKSLPAYPFCLSFLMPILNPRTGTQARAVQ